MADAPRFTRVIIDTSKFPRRRVTAIKVVSPTNRARKFSPDLRNLVTLECGHKVGVRAGYDVLRYYPCRECYKLARKYK